MISPCPSCPDGYVWNSNGPTSKQCPTCHGTATVGQEQCPECGSWLTDRLHHEATFAVPECDYWRCEICDHQWGHE